MAIGLSVACVVVGGEMHWPATLGWILALLVAGFGVGIAWPHLSAWIMGAAGDDPVEGSAAAAAINTVQLISGAFGAGLAGVVVNMAHAGDAEAARWMFGVFAALAAAGIIAAHKSRP
jgi:MFS family permease